MSIARIYIVTGASRGLGEAIADALAAPDAAVVGLSRGTSRTLEARAAAGLHVEQVGCDLTDTDALDAIVGDVLGRLPLARCTLVALVNNAGIVEPVGPAGSLAASDVARHLALNLTAPVLLANAFLRETASFAGSRRILNISSGAGRRALAGWSAYCTGKAGLDQFTRTVSLEQQDAPNPARIVALAPGVIDTDMQAVVRSQDASRFPDVGRFVELHRTGLLVAPADAARRIATFLHGDDFGSREIADLREMA